MAPYFAFASFINELVCGLQPLNQRFQKMDTILKPLIKTEFWFQNLAV